MRALQRMIDFVRLLGPARDQGMRILATQRNDSISPQIERLKLLLVILQPEQGTHDAEKAAFFVEQRTRNDQHFAPGAPIG